MDTELKTYLDGMEARLRGQTDQFLNLMDAMEARLREQIEASEARQRDHTEVVETRLLQEFWKWARTADARYRQNQAVVGALDDRVQAVEDRVAELERKRA